jgi:hypothetical protein
METPPLLLNQPTVSEGVMRAFGMKGDLPQWIRSVYDMSIQADDLTRAPYCFLRRQTLSQYRMSGAGAVGFPSVAQFTVKASPSIAAANTGRFLIHVLGLWVSNPSGAAQTLLVGLTPNLSAGITFTTGALQRDDRLRWDNAFALNGAGIVGFNNAAAAPSYGGAGPLVVTLATADSQFVPVDYVLTGLQLLTVATTGTNQPLDVTAICFERPLLAEEL